MRLSDLLTPERVKLPLTARGKDEVLRELVDVVMADRDIDTRAAITEALREREAILSTGIGDGIAIPHAKTPLVDRLLIGVGVSDPPVDFDALDGNPVELFFILLGPETAGAAHLKALGRISRLLRRERFRDALRESPDAVSLYQAIRDAEAS